MALRTIRSANFAHTVRADAMKSPEDLVLKVSDLSRFRNGHPVVQSVSFSLRRGEIVGLLGANGAGKTTTLRMIAQVLRPSGGEVEVMGCNPRSSRGSAMKYIGYLPQQPPLYEELTVREQLSFVAELMGVASNLRKTAVSRVVELCDLSDVTQMLCGHLSTGFRKRVGIAGALVHTPALILLDEPFTGLDPMQRASLRSTLSELGKQQAILLSTHLLSEVSQFCTRALVMSAGKLHSDMKLDSNSTSAHLERSFMRVLEGQYISNKTNDRLAEIVNSAEEFSLVGNH